MRRVSNKVGWVFCLLLLAFFVYGDEGCCLNPLIDPEYYCTADMISVETCCPADPFYYYRDEMPYGPTYGIGECEADYFEPGVDCTAYADSCDRGCCCGSDLDDNPLNIEKKRCEETGGVFYDGSCPTDCDGGGGGGPGEPGDCDNPLYVPEFSVLVRPVQGEKRFNLQWNDSCVATEYVVERCLDGSCIEVGTTSTTQFVDSSLELLWDTNYEYKVHGTYSVQGEITNDDRYTANLGNLECWGADVDTYFCIHQSYYSQFKPYLEDLDPDYISDFPGTIAQHYGSRFNSAFFCRTNNRLSSSLITCPSDDNKVCVIESELYTCVERSRCMPEDFRVDPFGMFSFKEMCHDLGYCFYDKSPTLVDKCYSCSPAMDCYDYKLEDSCATDHCSVGNCEWRDIISDFEIGVCINTMGSNCHWCDKTGTMGVSEEAYNKVLDICTPEKAGALSTAGFSCIYTDGMAIACERLACPDLDSLAETTACPIYAPPLTIFNRFANSPSGSCDLGICQSFAGFCRKNADGNNEPDCEQGDMQCELDIYRPKTILETELDEEGVVYKIGVDIWDDVIEDMHTGDMADPSDYLTYLCIDGPGSNSCLNTPGIEYSISFSDYALSVNGLRLSEWSSDTEIATLSEGVNTIYYYSRDLANNLGIVNYTEVRVYSGDSRPEIYDILIDIGEYYGGSLYTNSGTPTITVKFRAGGAELRSAKIRDLASQTTDLVIWPTPSLGVTEYILSLPSGTSLSGGEYTLELSAVNHHGRPLSLSDRETPLLVDFTAPTVIITPPPIEFVGVDYIVNGTDVEVTLEFSKEVRLLSLNVIGDNNSFNLTDGYDSSYSYDLSMDNGEKTVSVSAKDHYGNTVQATSSFIVKAHPPNLDSLWIVEPSQGVSSNYTFDLMLESDTEFECRYTIDLPVSDDSDYDILMLEFDYSYGMNHMKDGIELTDENPHTLNVWCKDIFWRDAPFRYQFNLKVDTTEPIINSLLSHPSNPVAELPTTLKLMAETNEPVICKYSEVSSVYDFMEHKFKDYDEPDFRTVSKAYINLSIEREYSYMVACENEAELISDTHNITVAVNTSAPLIITDHTDNFQTEESPTIAIETNKRAICKYSFTDQDVVTGPRLGTDDTYFHTATLDVNVTSGSHTIYVRCFTSGESVTHTVSIIQETTAPEMEYVNDTSRIDDYPEFSYDRDRLYVRWLATDEESGSRGLSYNYSLIERVSQKKIINWTEGDDLNYDGNRFSGWIRYDHDGEDLNLTDKTSYIFKVRAGNVVGLWSDVMSSDGVITDFSLENTSANTCTNGVTDGTETDVDCGGSCEGCELNESCEEDADCLSDYCSSDGVCLDADCDDGEENGDETDVDCGGDDCEACENSDSCLEDSDCSSGNCKYNECVESLDTCENEQLDSNEADTDCGGVCPDKCGEDSYCDIDSDCASGLSCVDDRCSVTEPEDEQVSDTDGDGIPDSWENEYNMDPSDPSDADLDYDNDGLTNYDEYRRGTNPNNPDTDGDGYEDMVELEKGTDPTDPNDKPASPLKVILLILLILIILAAIGYLVYTQYFDKKNSAILRTPFKQSPMQRGMAKPRKPMGVPVKRDFRDKKEHKRSSLFESFGGKKEEKITESKGSGSTGGYYIDLTKEKMPELSSEKTTIKKPKDEVFKRLSTMIEGAPKSDDKSLSKISKVTKEASKEIKKDLKKHATKVDGRLKEVEKKVAVISKPTPVLATKTGAKYHKPGCITIKGKAKSEIVRFKDYKLAKKKKLKPCTVCKPK